MHAFTPRSMDYTIDGVTTSYDAGYHNTALGTAGVAISFPPGARGAIVSVGAGCYIGVRATNTLEAFNDNNYGSILNGQPYPVGRLARSDSNTFIHIGTWTSTTSVAVAFF